MGPDSAITALPACSHVAAHSRASSRDSERCAGKPRSMSPKVAAPKRSSNGPEPVRSLPSPSSAAMCEVSALMASSVTEASPTIDAATRLRKSATCAAGLLAMAGKIGQSLRDNEWLMSIRSRAAIPGGVCQFDLPAYHYWLNLDPAQRRADLEAWLQPIAPIRSGQQIVLRLLRSSGRPDPACRARSGLFQQTMTGRVAQMLRVRVPRSETVVPEISANKYALNIRFMLPETVGRPRVAERDVPFELTFCSL